MSTENMQAHINKLEELIFDDDKIISVWGLAALLNVPVVESKEILLKFIKDTKEKHPDRSLAVTYTLIGTLKKNNTKSVTVVKEDQLNAKRLEFSDINDECVYSVQKNKNIDLNVVALANEEALGELEGPLKKLVLASKNCTKRNIKKRAPPVVPEKEPVKNVEPKKEEGTSSKQNGIKNLFNNMPAKSKKEPVKKESQKPKANALSAFLASQPAKTKQKAEIDQGKSPVKENDENKCHNTEKMEVDEKMDVEKKEKCSKRQRKDKNSSQLAKKRKRIVINDGSDSDDIFGDENEENNAIKEFDDDDDEIVMEKPMKVQESAPVPKNKRRKSVERTYEDEEGFIVTKTEYIYETASETEEEPAKESKIEKTEPKKETAKKKASSSSIEEVSPKKSTGGGKKNNKKAVASNQKSITSFFKRK